MRCNKPLFISGNKTFFVRDVVKRLHSVGIQTGDVIFIHSDLAAFGKLAGQWDRTTFVNCFIDAILGVVGKTGTVIVPTYTYSYCAKEVYDPDTSASKVGTLSEVFRKRPDAVRSLHPIFSVSAIGKNAKMYTTNIGNDGFGKDSVFDRLLKRKNARYVIFGVPYFSCNVVHLIERVRGVPYRFLKNFTGITRIHHREQQTNCEYYVRYLDKDVVPSFDKIEQHLLNKRFMSKVQLGSGWISSTRVSDIYTEGLALLGQDPHIFLEGTPNL